MSESAMATLELPELIKPQQLAKFYQINPVTLWRWSRDGRHPKPLKLGPGTALYKRSDVERFLEERSASEA